MDVTGYLPRIDRSKAVCWKGSQLYIKGDACYPNAPKYLTEKETREYMKARFGYKTEDLNKKAFDYSVTPDLSRTQLENLTITKSGRLLYQEGTPIQSTPAGVHEEVVTDLSGKRVTSVIVPGPGDVKDLVEGGGSKVGMGINQAVDSVKKPINAVGLGIGGALLVIAAAIMFFRSGKK